MKSFRKKYQWLVSNNQFIFSPAIKYIEANHKRKAGKISRTTSRSAEPAGLWESFPEDPGQVGRKVNLPPHWREIKCVQIVTSHFLILHFLLSDCFFLLYSHCWQELCKPRNLECFIFFTEFCEFRICVCETHPTESDDEKEEEEGSDDRSKEEPPNGDCLKCIHSVQLGIGGSPIWWVNFMRTILWYKMAMDRMLIFMMLDRMTGCVSY